MDFLMSILGGAGSLALLLVFFGVCIFVHELGHFLVAKACGLVVEVFSIGIGPAIWKRTYRGVVYKIGLFPIGGYVALPQLDPTGMNRIQGESGGEAGSAKALPPIPGWKKILVSLAGAAGNIVLAVLLAWMIYLAPNSGPGQVQPRVGFVSTNSVAYGAGLRPGDVITAVNGKSVGTWYDYSVETYLGGKTGHADLTYTSQSNTNTVELPLDKSLYGIQGVGRVLPCLVYGVKEGGPAEAAGVLTNDLVKAVDGEPVLCAEHLVSLLRDRGGQPVRLTLERAKSTVEVAVTPEFNAEVGRAVIGVIPVDVEDAVAWMQYKRPSDQIRNDAVGILRLLQALGTPHESRRAAEGLGGPVFIFVALGAAIKMSWLNAVGFIRFLNVNLAIVNLLPIPVLDGGHILFALLEMVRRKPLNARFVNAVVNVFAILLLSLILLLSVRDVDRFTPVGRYVRGMLSHDKADAMPASVTNAPAPPDATATPE